MFIQSQAYFERNGRYFRDYRFNCLDDSIDSKAIKKASKQAAMAEWKKDTEKYSKAVRRLDGIMKRVDLQSLNVLSDIYMIVHPDTEAGATGKGQAWAVASRIVNERARLELKNRPMFELA